MEFLQGEKKKKSLSFVHRELQWWASGGERPSQLINEVEENKFFHRNRNSVCKGACACVREKIDRQRKAYGSNTVGMKVVISLEIKL